MTETAVYAAGAVCWRLIDGKMHVLVIHRTVHGDVTIPRARWIPESHSPGTAVREINEETGLSVALGVRSASRTTGCQRPRQDRALLGGRSTEQAILRSTFVPNGEVAALEWVTIKRARTYLSYPAMSRSSSPSSASWTTG
jgi:8-oxo-dGTP diphosphatase